MYGSVDIELYKMIPRTDIELWYWVKNVLNIEIPGKPGESFETCTHHTSPFKAFADAYFARYPVIVWEASRGFGGKSFLLATLSLTEQITLGSAISLLGGSGEQSARIHAYLAGEDPNSMGKFWDSPDAPRHMLKTEPTKRETRTTNGGYIKALAASQKSVRGPHPNRVRFDEVDETDKVLLDAAMGQTMESRGIKAQTVLSSTHHHPDGTMTKIKELAQEKGWPVYEWCYRESLATRGGWLAPSEVERKKQEVPQSMWDNEYENQEPSPKKRAIDPDAVDELFDERLGRFEGNAGEEIIIDKPSFEDIFYHGTDWAKDVDWTIIHSMKSGGRMPDKLVAWLRLGREPWPKMIERHNHRVRSYGGKSYHDSTGVGNVCNDYLDVPSKGINYARRKLRTKMLTSYIAAIESGEIVFPMIYYAYNEHKFASNDKLFGTKHLPDSISAGALANLYRVYQGNEIFSQDYV